MPIAAECRPPAEPEAPGIEEISRDRLRLREVETRQRVGADATARKLGWIAQVREPPCMASPAYRYCNRDDGQTPAESHQIRVFETLVSETLNHFGYGMRGRFGKVPDRSEVWDVESSHSLPNRLEARAELCAGSRLGIPWEHPP